MDGLELEYKIDMLCSGGVILTLDNGDIFFIDLRISPKDRYIINQKYRFFYNKAREEYSLPTEQEIIADLIKNNVIEKDFVAEMMEVSDEIKKLKGQYYANILNDKIRIPISKKIDALEEKVKKISTKKFHYTNQGTCESYAKESSNKYKYSICVKNLDGSPIDEDLIVQSVIVNEIEHCIYDNYIVEKEMREIARSGKWRSLWGMSDKKPKDIFEVGVSCFSDQQKDLCSWSSFYDSVYEAYERPSKDIIEDDIALDAWYSGKIKEQEKETAKKSMLKNNDAKEVYIPTDVKNAKKVYDLNDDHVRKAIKSRNKEISEKGAVNEKDLIKSDGKTRAGIFINEKRK